MRHDDNLAGTLIGFPMAFLAVSSPGASRCACTLPPMANAYRSTLAARRSPP